MKVIQTALGKNHYFHLARYLHQQNALECIYSGYPWFKLKNEQLPKSKIKTFPWLRTPFMVPAIRDLRNLKHIFHHWDYLSQASLDWYVSKNLKGCDVFIGQSQNGLLSGKKAKQQGALYVCDRPCSHIRHQSEILKEELDLWNLKASPGNSVDQRSVFVEEQEYELADYVVVLSEFARRSFLTKGYPQNKVIKISLGADLSRFQKISDPDFQNFTVLFVGQVNVRKGFLYLLEAFKNLKIQKKRLIVIGPLSFSIKDHINKMSVSNVEFHNHIDNSQLYKFYNQAHVFVLPSIEDGFGMVMAEALACGCPVIATENTGAHDLFENGKEGFIVPIRDVRALAEKMQLLYEDKALRAKMSEAALEKIKSLGGWETYGKNYYEFLKANLKK